jgi:hypothetical protein
VAPALPTKTMVIDPSGLAVSSSFAGGTGTVHAACARVGLPATANPKDNRVTAVMAPAIRRSVLFM